MCGIVYAHNKDGSAVNNDILNIFDNQRSRGLQGFGLYDGQEGHIVKEVQEDGILKWLCKYNSNLILFHHRYPTSTDNVRKAAHPFSTKKHFGKVQYILVHNGHISNSKELRAEHEKLGIKYQSITDDGRFNDSEALLWDFALTMQKKQAELKAKGGIAFICVETRNGKPTNLYFGRNTNPLVLNTSGDGIRLSSQGDGQTIDPQRLYTYVYKTGAITDIPFEIPGYEYAGSTTGSYPRSSHSNGWNWQNEQYGHSYKNTQTYENSLDDEHIGWFNKTKQKLLGSGALVLTEPTIEDIEERFLTEEEVMEEMETFIPDPQEIQNRAFNYMNYCNGHYRSAYNMMEQDCYYLEADAEYLYDYKEVRTIELAMKLLEDDPKWNDEDAVSPTWLSDKQQTRLAIG